MKRIMLVIGVIVSFAFMTTQMGVGGDNVALGQETLPAPANVRVVNGPNLGEVVLSWDAVAGAAYYRIGWMADPDFRAARAAGREWRDEFRYSDIANRGQTSRAITRLSPGIVYWFTVGSNANLRGVPAWSEGVKLELAGHPTSWGGPIPESEVSWSELRYQKIDAGKNHTCGITQDNTVACWGDNTHGQTNAPTGKFLSVSAGGVYSCGIDFENQLQCWGHSGIPAPPEGSYTDVAVGENHACAVTVAVNNKNRIVCWGLSNNDGRTANQGENSAGPWLSVSTSSNYNCTLNRGHLGRNTYSICWGSNSGNYNRFDNQNALQVVSAGSAHICGLYHNASIACHGNDVHNQVSGRPNAQDEGSPADFYTYTAISAGGRHTCGLRTSGNIRCWGDDQRGQATPPGDNDELRAGELGVGDFIAVSAGDTHTCGLRDNGVVGCWGYNNHGQAAPR